ncbi:hypothetical protein QBC36DRAFT_191281 [Triangularia setosa]|uniref:Extracellular membrane protein CFEM domain-containing protein n=1 Tax=Triangularia setosa TaxID=2587417 RepID=A0AAN7A5J1_9PEZI|nr:hypothetical protein QBC36DRAFT_191281 [Podospora setosa]
MRTYLLSFLAASTLSVTAQRIFINQVPEYSELPPCAEAPLSNVVRNMVSGCGDGGKTTSYNCFCASSSTKFESIISRVVASKCLPVEPEATASALAVFGSYCHLSPQAAPALASQTAASPTENRPLFSSESTITALELSTLLLMTAGSDASSTLVAAASAEDTVVGSSGGSSVWQSPARLSPTPSRTQFAPIPSASLALSGAQCLGSQWLASCLVLLGSGIVML